MWRQNTGTFFNMEGRPVKVSVAGAADITGIGPGGVRLEIETKRTKGGVQSPEQKKFQAMIERCGGVYILANSPEVAVAQVKKRLGPPRT